MSDILVTSPFQPFILPTQFKAVFNGYIYCGTVDAVDPSVSQVQVYLVNESGDKVPVAQPLRTNAGGYLVYNGHPAKFVTDSNHSLLVQDSFHVQVWYAHDVSKVDPDSLSDDLAGPNGSSLIGFIQSGTGAVTRNAQDKMRESFSVKDFGAKGDGTTDDSAAIQAAFYQAGVFGFDIYFPPGIYVINSTVSLPTQSISIYGAWVNTVIKGSASPIFAYPSVVGKVHNISRLSFEYYGVAINASKIWSAAGIEPSAIVSECRFKSLAANSKAIILSGIWASRIYGNSFVGTSRTADEIGIHIINDNSDSSSVMNTDIHNNSSILLSYPVKYDGRTLPTGGRVEGVSIIGNRFIAGKVGVKTVQTLATCINNNMINDFDVPIDMYGDFDFNITGNSDLQGSTACIRLTELSTSIMERGVISGNKIRPGANAGSGGILLTTTTATIRGISISGNAFGKVGVGQKPDYGIKLSGNRNFNLAITGNIFYYLVNAIDRGTDTNQNTINGNTYDQVDNTGVSSPHNTPFTKQLTQLLTSTTSFTLTVALPAGAARDRPAYASCVLASSAGGSPIVCSYLYDTSTKDNIQFLIVRSDGSALPAANVRFAVAALLF